MINANDATDLNRQKETADRIIEITSVVGKRIMVLGCVDEWLPFLLIDRGVSFVQCLIDNQEDTIKCERRTLDYPNVCFVYQLPNAYGSVALIRVDLVVCTGSQWLSVAALIARESRCDVIKTYVDETVTVKVDPLPVVKMMDLSGNVSFLI